MDTTKELTEHIADREMNMAAELTTPGTARKLISTANITVDWKRSELHHGELQLKETTYEDGNIAPVAIEPDNIFGPPRIVQNIIYPCVSQEFVLRSWGAAEKDVRKH